MWMLAATLLFLQSVQDATVPLHGKAVHTAEGRGVQIYRCLEHDGDFRWTFEAPEATLYDRSGQPVATHAAGPSWKWADGSSVLGTIVSKKDAPGSIPWLLLSASPATAVHGVLSAVIWVRRSDTQGGVAPATGCDASHEHQTSRIPYSATYTFYASGPADR